MKKRKIKKSKIFLWIGESVSIKQGSFTKTKEIKRRRITDVHGKDRWDWDNEKKLKNERWKRNGSAEELSSQQGPQPVTKSSPVIAVATEPWWIATALKYKAPWHSTSGHNAGTAVTETQQRGLTDLSGRNVYCVGLVKGWGWCACVCASRGFTGPPWKINRDPGMMVSGVMRRTG